MSSFGLGVAAALAAPLVMTIGFIVWDNHWGGSAFSLNLFKCNMASLGFLILSLTTRSGGLFPADVFTRQSVGFLMLSSTIGILIGDWTWLEGLRLLGATRVILVDTCKPFLAALFGWAILGESLRPPAFGGMALTVVGILIVSLESEKSQDGEDAADGNDEVNGEEETGEMTTAGASSDLDINSEESIERSEEVSSCAQSETPSVGMEESTSERRSSTRQRRLNPRRLRKGYSMSVLNVVLDTYGSVLTKEYGVGMTTWEINLIRFGFAGSVMLSLSLALHLKHWCAVYQKGDDSGVPSNDANDDDVEKKQDWYSLPRNMTRTSWLQVCVGVLLVTFCTPALSNYALFQIALALTLTLTSVGPLYALPLVWLLQHDRPTLRACAGAVLGVAGIVVLSFWGQQQQ